MSGMLWYRRPARQWVEALPLGNGRIGAMVFGAADRERIALNEDTLWSGAPGRESRPEAFGALNRARALVEEGKMVEAEAVLTRDFLSRYSEAYMPLGDLRLGFGHEIAPGTYRRALDLARAECTVEYETPDGTRFTREIIVSAPDQALILRLRASKKGALSFSAALETQLRGETRALGSGICLMAQCPSHAQPQYLRDPNPLEWSSVPEKMGIRYCALLNAQTDGTIANEGGALRVANATEAVLALTCRSNFAGWNVAPETAGAPYFENAKADWEALRGKLDGAFERHIQEHSAWWMRCGIRLDGESHEELPTDERLLAHAAGQEDAGLFELLFDYGRYLMIAGSRPGTQPTNLQGIWNESIIPPWSSNYTTNINTEMNYWPVLSANLAEMQEPLNRFLGELRVSGAETAREYYHARGFVCHHNTDLWRLTVPVGRDREGMVPCAFWPMASGWLATHLYEQWKYAPDEQFLRETAYPILKDAARFYLDCLTEDGRGHRIMSPSTSPENRYLLNGATLGLVRTATMTTAILREVFSDCLEMSAQVPGEAEFARELAQALADLPPYEIDSEGRLMEWPEELCEKEITHRHVSHLFGLYPARQITPEDTPELANACRKSLEKRTDIGTGWSMGWKICLWARLEDGDHALKLIDRQLTPAGMDDFETHHTGGGTYPNLMDAHPPFQIDGNFGACAGIAEMLVQSRRDGIRILPALPKRWGSGAARGLRAYGGLTIDLEWANGRLTAIAVSAQTDASARLYLPGEAIDLTLRAGERFSPQF